MFDYLILLTAIVISFILFYLLTDPSSKIKKSIPHLQIKWLQILPNLQIHVRDRIFIIHHWFGLSIILVVSIIFNESFISSPLSRGFLLGGIIHGFSYSDWKNFTKKKTVQIE